MGAMQGWHLLLRTKRKSVVCSFPTFCGSLAGTMPTNKGQTPSAGHASVLCWAKTPL